MSSIEWLATLLNDGTVVKGKTWNPTRGCSPVSPGCANCYATRSAIRTAGPGGAYEGLVKLVKRDGKSLPKWTGEFREVSKRLADPLSWRGSAARMIERGGRLRVFVNSMSDLFHERANFEFVAAVFGVMAACPDIDFQILTKRPARMLEWYEWVFAEAALRDVPIGREWNPADVCIDEAFQYDDGPLSRGRPERAGQYAWPLPNVHVGVSVEDQKRAGERIPLLLQVTAAVRWVSLEPLLGPVDLSEWMWAGRCEFCGERIRILHNAQTCACCVEGPEPADISPLDWAVIGGESGPGARPYDLAWVASLIEQCKDAGLPVFHKQLGSGERLHANMRRQPDAGEPIVGWHSYRDPKGADMAEWPAELRVRQYPTTREGQ